MKKFYIVFFVLCILAITGGCATEEQIEKLKAVEKQAESNAVNYIREKYGFEVDVEEVEGETGEDTLFPNHEPTGYTFVTVEYSDKEFQVYITGEEESAVGRDNYQKDEIMKAVEERAADTFAFDTDNVHIYTKYVGSDDLFIGPFYDGTNLEEVIDKAGVYWIYKVITTDLDLQSIDTGSIVDKLGEHAEIEIINCYDEEAYETVKNGEFTYELNEIEDYGIYVDDYIAFSGEESEYVDLNLVEHDAFSVVMIGGTYCDVTETTVDPMEWKGHGFMNPKQVFGAYAIETDAQRVFFFIDVNKLDTDNYQKAQIAKKYEREGEELYKNGILTEYIEPSYITDNVWSRDYTNIVISVFEDQ